MPKTKYWISLLSCSLLMSIASSIQGVRSAQGAVLVNNLVIPGESTDLAVGSGVNINRLGGFFSDLYYDRHQNLYYGLIDRGPGGGTIPYDTRVEKFSLDVNATTGAISGFKLLDTILLTNAGKNYNGLNPNLQNGDSSKVGLSLDPEGFAIAPNGNFYIADEYGPSINEFSASGSLVRSFTTPNNLLPRDATGLNFVAGRPIVISGRQDNRGYEGVTLSPDGSKLFALLQDPLVNEGGTSASPDGRRSRNLRLVEFDTKTGDNTGQYIYQLEDISTINDRIPGTANDFTATQQGRSIGISAITALNNSEFLVLERDNRGFGVDDPTAANPIGSKRVYKINLDGATNVRDTSLAGTNVLPVGINAVSKSLFLDIADALKTSGSTIPEKIEGLAIGPQLTDGSYALLIGTDNDFSVTQNGSNVQFDVCTDGSTIALGSGCPTGSTLIPTYLYSFKASGAELKGFVPPAKVPEPASAIGLALIAVGAFGLKRKQTAQ